MTPAQELRSLLGSPAERRAWLAELGPQLPAALRERLTRILELAGCLLELLDTKNLSIKKLQQLFFGAKTERSQNVCGTVPKDKSKAKAKGHGRHSHGQYTGARRIAVSHPTLRPGHRCPACQRGKLRRRPRPAVAIHVSAQPPIGATIHELEQLRCDTCGKLFTAPLPPAAGAEKYDASVGVMIGLMRYGSGLPFYRLERLQLSFPEECRKVIDLIAEVYQVEKQIKAGGLSAQARLEAHQAQSQPMMEQLKAWLTQQVEDRKVEPNSNLGKAIRYMQDRWHELTQFLRVPGAPLDK